MGAPTQGAAADAADGSTPYPSVVSDVTSFACTAWPSTRTCWQADGWRDRSQALGQGAASRTKGSMQQERCRQYTQTPERSLRPNTNGKKRSSLEDDSAAACYFLKDNHFKSEEELWRSLRLVQQRLVGLFFSGCSEREGL